MHAGPSGNGEAEDDRFSFAPFTRHAFFSEVNRWIVERVIDPGRRVIVDLGCGPGAVTKLILEKLARVGRCNGECGARVIGIDPSASALERARAAIPPQLAEFVQGTAESLSGIVPQADAVVFLNAIHLVQDKARVIGEVRKVLPAGGAFAFNSTFFNGAYVEGTSKFWRRWIVRAVQALRERGLDVQHTEKATARDFLSPEQYSELCVAAGFAPPDIQLVKVDFTFESMRDIGRFSLFIEGALPGVPLAEGAQALEVGLTRTMDELGVSTVPRFWMEAVATAA